jgi:acetyltransferase-like isoleucine patch superfamily enzyme
MGIIKKLIANPVVRYYRDLLITWKSSSVHPNATILPGAVLRSCRVSEWATVGHDVNLVNVNVGRYSYISIGSRLANCAIGPFCSIGGNVVVAPGRHPINFVSSHPFFYSNEHPQYPPANISVDFLQNETVTIGADVWIGLNAVILDGMSIGDGAVVAANAVVTSDVPPYAVVAGVPARIVRYRFDEETRVALQRSRWWDRDDQWLAANKSKFMDVQRFVNDMHEGEE